MYVLLENTHRKKLLSVSSSYFTFLSTNVEERGKAIERSEIVWGLTPPARKIVWLKVSLGAHEWCQTNDFTCFHCWNHIRTSEFCLHIEDVIKFYCWLLKKQLFAFLYFKLFMVTSSLGATPRQTEQFTPHEQCLHFPVESFNRWTPASSPGLWGLRRQLQWALEYISYLSYLRKLVETSGYTEAWGWKVHL
jgi:hypothetical protein